MSATGIPEQLCQPDASRVGRVWRVVCPLEAMIPGRGIAAMVGGTQVAVFRVEWCLTPFDAGSSEAVLAIVDLDPFSGAEVLSRGVVGDVDGEPVVGPPVSTHSFALHTGPRPDDPTGTVTHRTNGKAQARD